MSLYQVQDPSQKALGGLGQASQSYASMQKAQPEPEKTVGGALMSGLGGATAGAGIGMAVASGPVGWGVIGGGAAVGALSYLLS
ncbi:hypothetical protein LZ24_03428 [Desulfobotulus alkaliphilus]|uniref:Uncharacterized protein n=1 Tax=Desulfobotulus alkaliphilus TaxID=622671 RepID=A0A562QXT9_9BACT|nr:hypothetical protein [Desulfobotulus alkaliphilus]TWI61612.1 hypothetical protein LZ24_03428 [Desulfobotulus alkaliphilus]